MKKNSKKFWQDVTLGSAIGIVIAALIIVGTIFASYRMGQQISQRSKFYLEVGMKSSDVKWLYRAGKVSEEELNQLQEATAGGMDIDKVNELLDSILDGKEKDYLQEKQEEFEAIFNDNN